MAFRLSPHMSENNSQNDYDADIDILLGNTCTQTLESSCDLFPSQEFVVPRPPIVNNKFSDENELSVDNSQDLAGILQSAQSLSDEDCDLISQGSLDSDETHCSEADNMVELHYKRQKSENCLSNSVFPRRVGKANPALSVSRFAGKALAIKKSGDYIFVKEDELPEACSGNLYASLEDMLLPVGLTETELANEYRYHKLFITLMCAQHVKLLCRNMASRMLASEDDVNDMIENLRKIVFDR